MRHIIAIIAATVGGFVLLAAMRATAPDYDRIIGPIPYRGPPGEKVATGNLSVIAGQPQLARAIRFRFAGGPAITRDTAGVWLAVPLTSMVSRKTARVLEQVWLARDGRRYAASARLGEADAVLTGKLVQPGMDRKDLVVFELPLDAVQGGKLLLSEETEPRLASEVQIAFPDASPSPVAAMIDLDQLDAKL